MFNLYNDLVKLVVILILGYSMQRPQLLSDIKRVESPAGKSDCSINCPELSI
jgi:hypothetical protein